MGSLFSSDSKRTQGERQNEWMDMSDEANRTKHWPWVSVGGEYPRIFCTTLFLQLFYTFEIISIENVVRETVTTNWRLNLGYGQKGRFSPGCLRGSFRFCQRAVQTAWTPFQMYLLFLLAARFYFPSVLGSYVSQKSKNRNVNQVS